MQENILGGNSNTIYMDVFYKVYSNITGIKEIVGDNND